MRSHILGFGLLLITISAVAQQTPSQPAVLTGCRWRIAQQTRAKVPISGTVPYFPEILLCRVAERVVAVTADGERRDAAGESASVGGEIHERPRAPASGPGAIILPLKAEPRFRRAGGVKCHPERPSHCLRCLNRSLLGFLRAFEQRIARRGLAVADLVEYEALQMSIGAQKGPSIGVQKGPPGSVLCR